MRKIAVISDIHANFFALNLAIDQILSEEVDLIVINGDLLTYGTKPNEVLDKLLWLNDRIPCKFVIGNHDEIYFNSIDSAQYINNAPEFVKESIEWTKLRCELDLEEIFSWHRDFTIDDIFISHANFKMNNWTYLNNKDEVLRNLENLTKSDYKLGIFGHVHREYMMLNNNLIDDIDLALDSSEKDTAIIVTPSIGQPRGNLSGYLIIEISESIINCSLRHLIYDHSDHIELINSSSMSETTKINLIKYFK